MCSWQEIVTLLSTYVCSSSLVSPPDMATLATVGCTLRCMLVMCSHNGGQSRRAISWDSWLIQTDSVQISIGNNGKQVFHETILTYPGPYASAKMWSCPCITDKILRNSLCKTIPADGRVKLWGKWWPVKCDSRLWSSITYTFLETGWECTTSCIHYVVPTYYCLEHGWSHRPIAE